MTVAPDGTIYFTAGISGSPLYKYDGNVVTPVAGKGPLSIADGTPIDGKGKVRVS